MERPILFNTDMVKAILEGRKTQTRRIVKPQLSEFAEIKMFGEKPTPFYCADGHQTEIKAPCYIGDTLWVRETWKCEQLSFPGERDTYSYIYKADDENPSGWHLDNWKPSIHMPRAAARIFLEVTGVRAERLQNITEIDSYHEGFMATVDDEQYVMVSAKGKFKLTWDSIYNNWNENPWVWAIEFERMV